MSWRAVNVSDCRKAFMQRLREDEHTSLSALCREFGISRTTAYKWQSRYDADDAASVQDRSRAPLRHPNATSPSVEALLLSVRRVHPTWGPKKICAYLYRNDPALLCPSASTVGQILKTNGLIESRKRKRAHPHVPVTTPEDGTPNALWTVDFKGQFLTGNGDWCYPLTLMDHHSRYLLRCQAFPGIRSEDVQRLMEAAFREYDLPLAIKSDNGPPFGASGVARLSRLGVWWTRLGIRLVPNRPAHPEDNAAHERFHRTLLADTATPPRSTRRSQQKVFLAYAQTYNQERPHEALGMRTPSDLYTPSPRPFPAKLPDVEVPDGAEPRYVFPNGCLRVRGKEVFLSENLAKLHVAFFPVTDRLSVVCFGHVLLNVFDEHKNSWLSAKAAAPVLAAFENSQRLQQATT